MPAGAQIQTGFLLMHFLWEREERTNQIILGPLFIPILPPCFFMIVGTCMRNPSWWGTGSSDCCLGKGHRCVCLQVGAQEVAWGVRTFSVQVLKLQISCVDQLLSCLLNQVVPLESFSKSTELLCDYSKNPFLLPWII